MQQLSMILHGGIKQKKRPKELLKSLIDLQGHVRLLVLLLQNGDTPIAEIPRTSLAGLEATNPDLRQELITELMMLRDQDPNEECNSERLSGSETSWPSEDPPASHGPDAAPGASSMPRTAQEKRPPPKPPSSSSGSQKVALAGCDVSYQSDLVRVDNLPVVDMWSPDEDHVWGALDKGCNSTCHSKAWGGLAEDRLRHHGLTSHGLTVQPRTLQV